MIGVVQMAAVEQSDGVATQQIPEEVWEMTRRLVDVLRPERVYLFGSVARGDTSPDSDYDLMVVVAESEAPQYRRSQDAHRILADFHQAKDVLVWTRSEFDKRTHLPASLPATILREGVLLHDSRTAEA